MFLGNMLGRADRVPPELFETMVLSGPCQSAQLRCATWAEAEEMHRLVVERVKALAEQAAP